MAINFNIGDIIQTLQNIGVYDYLLPFILIFAIIFAILEKTKILGTDKSNINAVVAFVVGFLLIVQQGIVATINNFLPRVSLIIIIFLMALLVIAMLAGKEYKGLQGTLFTFAAIISIIAIIIALSPDIGFSTYITSWGISEQDQETLLGIGILVFLLIIITIIITGKRKGTQNEPNKGGHLTKIDNMFNQGLKD